MSRISSASANHNKFIVSGSIAKLNLKRPNSQKEESSRAILVPGHNLKIFPSVWKKRDFRRVQTASKIVTKEERERQVERFEEDRKRLEWESKQRTLFLQEIDKAREEKFRNKIGQLSDDEENKTTKVLDRVSQAKNEEIEEVKRANRIILAAKCHVVRDAQINEKYEIHRGLREEELRLEKEMLQKCEKAIEEEQRQRDKMKILNEQHANELRKQLEKRELNKYLEARRIEEEAKALAKAQIAITNDRLAKENAKKEKILRIRNEFKQSSEITNFLKNLAFEEQRVAEMKAQEYMRVKRERERKLENEKRLAREQKQREADRLLVLQTKFLQTKDQQETLNMRRIQEQKEREFRQKEKDAAIKRKELETQMMRTREAQIDEMKRIRAIQEAKEQTEYEQTINKLKFAETKEIEKKRKLHEVKERYRKEIISQIEQKEQNKRELRLRVKTETNLEQESEKLRQQNIKNVIAAKVKAMREANIPEQFVRNVERQLNLNDK